tara:strand:+ start:97 stop:336 length:240 start_codon:yes stop_codon:yes gene_type:complete
MNKKVEYGLGIVLVGIVGTIIMPFFALVIVAVRLVAVVIDVCAFPYNCMIAYHEKFEREKSLSEALKRMTEDFDSTRNN